MSTTPAFHLGKKMICAFCNGCECACDTDHRGCCAAESQADLERRGHEGPHPGACAGGWVVYNVGAVDKQQDRRKQLHAAAAQRKGADARTDAKFFATSLRITPSRALKDRAAVVAAVTAILSRKNLSLETGCGHDISKRTAKGKVRHGTRCLDYWVPLKGTTVATPEPSDDFGNAVKAALSEPCATYASGYLTEYYRSRVATCGCHYARSDLRADADPHACQLDLKPGALPKTPGQMGLAAGLSVSAQAGWTRGGARAKDPVKFAAACVETVTLASPPPQQQQPPPAWTAVGHAVVYKGAAACLDVGRIVARSPAPRTPGKRDYMLDVSFPDHIAQLPVNELAPAPPPPSPAIFEQAAASQIGALQRQLEQARAAVEESEAAKEHADARRAKAEADAAKVRKDAAATGGTAADWTRLRAGFKQHWNGCMKLVELDPTAEPDVWSLDVVKRVLASAGMEWMIRQLKGQIGKAPPAAPKFPKGCDAEAHVKANTALFKGWERACTNYRLKVKKILGVFLLSICVTSQRCNELAECIGLIMGPMKDKHRAVLHGAFGLASSKETNRRNVKARQGKYHQDLNARLLQIVQELIEAGGRGCLALGWDDDYTKIVFRRTIDAESRAKTEYFWTTMAFRVKAVPGAKMPRYDPTKPPFNVAGFSDETITEILDAACPGLDDGYLDHLDTLLKQPSDGGVGVAASEHKDGSPLSKTAMRERTRDADHGNAAEADNMARMKEGTYYVDSLQQNFKSYLEFCRALIRLVSLPAAFKLLDNGFYLPCPEDWPAREFQEAVILQGWATKEERRRGPLHLGKLLYAACFHDATGPAAPELWDLWLQTSGLSGEEALLKLGNVARLVTVVTGPLHIYLNGCTDAYKFHEHTFLRPFHRAWVGREWTAPPFVCPGQPCMCMQQSHLPVCCNVVYTIARRR